MHTEGTHQNLRMGRTRLIAVGVLTIAASMTAFGQANTPAPADDTTAKKPDEKVITLEEYKVVSSFRGSLAAAAEKKEANQAIVEVIASEDIGKLPDVSIADSLTRVTGIAAQRQNGRNQTITIRGLNADFSTGMLNGREQVTTSENRAVDFDQYPAELLDTVVIYKTSAANLTGQGLAGTVDLQTVRPLSRTGRTVALNGYYETTAYGQLTPGAKGTGNRLSFSYIDQSPDHKVGWAFGYAHTDSPYAGKQFAAWGYPTDSAGNYELGGTKSYVRSSNLKRDGFMGVIEFKPNENIHSTIDIFYSKFEEKQYVRGLEIPLIWSSAQLQPGYTVTNGLVAQSVLKNINPVVRNDGAKRTDDPVSLGWNLKLGEKSEWPITLDAGYSNIKRTDEILESWSGLGFNGGAGAAADTMTVVLHPGNVPTITPTVDYTNTSLFTVTDPQGWQTWIQPNGGPGWLKFLKSKDELGQFKASTDHELKNNFFHDVEIGASFSDRYKFDGEGPSGLPSNSNGQAKSPLPTIIGTTDFSYLGIGKIYAYDPFAWMNSSAVTFIPDPSPDFVARRFQVEEKITQLYTQFNIDSKAGSVPVTGNLGLRAIGVNQTSKGYSANGNTLTPVTGGAKYWDFAPALNLNFKVADQSYVRFALSRQIARPRMYDMRAGRNWGYDPTKATSTDINNSPWSAGEAGNPNLRPWKADSIDLSFDKFFPENKGYFSLATFYKKLDNFIYTQSGIMDFTGYPIKGGTTPVLFQGITSHPANGQGGNIRGLEFTLSIASEMISKEIKGFGVTMGGAYTDSSIKPWGPTGGDAPIAGLSRKVANITFYYERYGFSARISEHYRSATRQYITQFGVPARGGDVNPNGGFDLAQPEKVVDAQVSYQFQNGPAKNLTLFAQAYNLNNEPQITLQSGDPRRVMNYQTYGASYSFGASYKF